MCCSYVLHALSVCPHHKTCYLPSAPAVSGWNPGVQNTRLSPDTAYTPVNMRVNKRLFTRRHMHTGIHALLCTHVNAHNLNQYMPTFIIPTYLLYTVCYTCICVVKLMYICAFTHRGMYHHHPFALLVFPLC